MTWGTLFYLILLGFGFIVSVFYLEFGTVALMGILGFVPLFMLIFLIFMRTMITVSVDAKNPVSEKDSMDRPARPSMILTIMNKNKFLPITKGIAKVKYENCFAGICGHMKVRFSVDVARSRDRRIVVPMLACGNVAITVEKVRIYDYLSIFAWTVGKNFQTQDILVLPPQKELYLADERWYNETTEDSDRFSPYKRGDDPSEIFDIRDFVDGDKIQRIHWKLSSKTGNLMVKDGSLPLTRALPVFIDLCIPGDGPERIEDTNILVQGIYSLAFFLIGKNIPATYIWYDRGGDVVQERLVEHEEELLWMFQDLFKCERTTDPDELVSAYLSWDKGRPRESAIYMTVAGHADLSGSGLTRDRLEVMYMKKDDIADETE